MVYFSLLNLLLWVGGVRRCFRVFESYILCEIFNRSRCLKQGNNFISIKHFKHCLKPLCPKHCLENVLCGLKFTRFNEEISNYVCASLLEINLCPKIPGNAKKRYWLPYLLNKYFPCRTIFRSCLMNTCSYGMQVRHWNGEKKSKEKGYTYNSLRCTYACTNYSYL